MKVHLDHKFELAILITVKTLITILAEYLDFINVFSKKSAIVLPKHTEINIHVINLEVGKQPSYKPIYSRGLRELKTLNIYIEINLTNRFIRLFKFFVDTPILFDKKPNRNF